MGSEFAVDLYFIPCALLQAPPHHPPKKKHHQFLLLSNIKITKLLNIYLWSKLSPLRGIWLNYVSERKKIFNE